MSPRSQAIGRAALCACLAIPAWAAGLQPDATRGEQIYARCLACHALASDRVGPRHCGLLGRRAGSVPGFRYSEAMQGAGIVWSEKSLDRFLANPMRVVPGTFMTYDGVPLAADRADLIAYLKQVNAGEVCKSGTPNP